LLQQQYVANFDLSETRDVMIADEDPSSYYSQQTGTPLTPPFGASERMVEVRSLIAQVADTDITVLIRGESGTGKELVARALCAGSVRRNNAFLKLNCAALPSELLESELFGYERGAFTGALQQKRGKFECANHGTMFLDEIGDMSVAVQAKLLQVLQDGEFSRLGGKHDLHVDVRVVAATNRNLEQAIAAGQFRSDLFFRLNVVCITVPPLRERRDEVTPLSDFFLKKYALQYRKPYVALSLETMQLAADYDWPGNIRELENLIKRTVVLGSDASIRKELIRGLTTAVSRRDRADAARASDVQGTRAISAARPHREEFPNVTPKACSAAADTGVPGSRSLKDVSRLAARATERELIARMLEQTKWNRKKAAARLGVSYKALLYKIKDCGLSKGVPG
jgi:two-component system, NtrC family, response regulator AtoC